MKYAKITTVDGQRFIVRITIANERVVSGYEVNRDGDEVVPTGFHNRLRITQRAMIKKLVPMRMNNTYATLEPEPKE